MKRQKVQSLLTFRQSTCHREMCFYELYWNALKSGTDFFDYFSPKRLILFFHWYPSLIFLFPLHFCSHSFIYFIRIFQSTQYDFRCFPEMIPFTFFIFRTIAATQPTGTAVFCIHIHSLIFIVYSILAGLPRQYCGRYFTTDQYRFRIDTIFTRKALYYAKSA